MEFTNTENKWWWVIHGAALERQFVERVCPKLHLKNPQINPEKKNNPYTYDLVIDGRPADLKTQNTPFFTARKYGIDPQYAVTLNKKDIRRYTKLYPNISIYFWVDWQSTEWNGVSVLRMSGVWRTGLGEVSMYARLGYALEHKYQRRVNDVAGNAKSSFVFDLRWFEGLWYNIAPYPEPGGENNDSMS